LRAYWRAEEGAGNKISDISDKQMHLIAAQDSELTWQSQPNADKEPLDYEDKWGKANAPNFSFHAPPHGLVLDEKKA